MPGVELRHLRYFLAVAESRNFTKASQRLRVAQPALGRQVNDLEEEIGVKPPRKPCGWRARLPRVNAVNFTSAIAAGFAEVAGSRVRISDFRRGTAGIRRGAE